MQQLEAAETGQLEADAEVDAEGDAAEGERALLALIAAGDRDALAQLYAVYQRRLFRYLCHLTPDRGLAEEILQDTLLAVWRSAGSFEARSSVRTWLFGVARRQAHNGLRRRGREVTNTDELDGVSDTAPGPEGRTLALEDRERLTAAMGQLSPLHREVLALVFVEGLGYGEVAAMLDIPEGTVKSRLSNGRRALRALLGAAREVKGC